MKKLLSLTLVSVMMFAMASIAFAQLPTPEKILIGTDKNGTSLNDVLTPGEEYMFPVKLRVAGGGDVDLTQEYLDEYYLRISKTGKGNTIGNMKLVRSGGVYFLQIAVKGGYPADETEEEYTLKLTRKTGSELIDTLTLTFDTGYSPVDDAYIDALDEGDYITVDNDRPVFTKDQLEKIARVNNYKRVTFTNRNWNFTVNVTDTGSVNMLNDASVAGDIIEKYPDYNTEFISFPGRPTFKSQGSMEVDVSDFTELYDGKFYVYEYSRGILSPVNSSYDEDTDMLTFPAKTLSQFVITDRQFPYLVVGTPSENPGTGAVA